MNMSESDLDLLLERNKSWVLRKTRDDPDFFRRLVGQQTPKYFWIGCSDSRVPATEIVDLDPGEMFVHRNVANLVQADDRNFDSALRYAVDVLRVDHVIVVGHYGCGGIRAAIEGTQDESISRWLSPVRDLYQANRDLLPAENAELRECRLCELNVMNQFSRLRANPVIVNAWRGGHDLFIHGLVYSLEDGLLRKVCVSGPASPHDKIG